jgi:hypothetical protein
MYHMISLSGPGPKRLRDVPKGMEQVTLPMMGARKVSELEHLVALLYDLAKPNRLLELRLPLGARRRALRVQHVQPAHAPVVVDRARVHHVRGCTDIGICADAPGQAAEQARCALRGRVGEAGEREEVERDGLQQSSAIDPSNPQRIHSRGR